MKYGFNLFNDNRNEMYVYTAGEDGYMPLILFVMYLYEKQQGIERFFNLKRHTEDAQETAKIWLSHQNKELTQECEDIVKYFDGFKEKKERLPKKLSVVPEGFWDTDGSIEDILKAPDNTVLPFSLYSSQLYTFLAMKTANFNGGTEGSPQTCPLSYIKFWGREEFSAAYKAIDNGFDHVINEIIRGFKTRCPQIEINENDLTIKVENYKSITFKEEMYPGF